ncbi:3-oxoacyl-[acyl-carrier-protein] reductase FabG [subsurface metagenome]
MEQIQAAAEEIHEMGKGCLPVATDVTSATQVEDMVNKTLSQFGKVDILVNNAGTIVRKGVLPLPGVKLPGWQLVTDLNTMMSEDEWHSVMDTNLTGTFLCCRAVGVHMINQKKGKIINISSVSADSVSPYYSSYNVSKAAINMFTRSLAIEWAPFNINVNAVGPGWFPTSLTTSRFEDAKLKAQMISGIPLGRVGELREVALLAVYLASPASNYLTGQTIYLDGGILAQ